MENKILAYLAILTAIMLISVPIALALDSTDAVATSRGKPAPEVIAPMQEPITDYKAMLERGAIKLCDSEGRTWDLDIDGFWLYGERCSPCRDVIGVVLWPVIVLFDDAAIAGATSNMWACVWTGEGFDCYWRNTAGKTGTGSMWFCEPTGTEYYAVIAGNGWNCLYADNDAYDMYGLLTSEFNSNWEAANIKLLVSDAQGAGTKRDCTKTNIQDGIAWMASVADEDDVCVFFYAGHGGHQPDVAPIDEGDGEDEYICPEGGDILDDELNTWLSAISGYKLVAIDSCFSGGFIKAEGMVSRSVPNLPRAEITDGFAQDFCRAGEDLCKAGFNVHTACDEDESAYGTAELNNGVFTYYLVEGLYGLADSEPDGDVDATEAHQYTRPKVVTYTSGIQNPCICPATTDPLIWVLG